MKTLRRQMLRAVRNLPHLAAPALMAALVLASSVATAGTRSHLHHPAVAPMPVSSFVETNSPHTGKKHKSGSHAGSVRANSRPSSATGSVSGKGKAGKAREGRHGRVKDPDTDPILMYRISRPADRRSMPDEHSDAAPRAGRGRSGARGEALARHAPSLHQPSLHQPSLHQPILVDRRGQPVSRARFAAMRAGAPAVRWTSRASSADRDMVAPVHDESSDRYASRGSDRHYKSSTSDAVASSPAAFADAHANSFANGISHPPANDPLPHVSAGGDPGTNLAGADIGSAIVMSSGSLRVPLPASAPASPVVQGFGAEVAIAPSDAGRVPGTTRRRDHPISPSALPGMASIANSAPQTLEDRDAITLAAVSPAVLPDIYDRNGRLLMPAPLKGSHEVLIHQNTMAANDGLERIPDDYELDRLRAGHALVGFPVSNSLRVSDDLPFNRRYARPWTVLFATDIGHDFFERFHQPLQVNSAVRTVSYQARLQRINGNAAATDGDAASPHLTGQAIDLGKRGMNSAELAWMRAYLMPLISSGKIDVEEEFQQACFHISVYRRYAGGRTPAHEIAQVRTLGTQTSNAQNGIDSQANP